MHAWESDRHIDLYRAVLSASSTTWAAALDCSFLEIEAFPVVLPVKFTVSSLFRTRMYCTPTGNSPRSDELRLVDDVDDAAAAAAAAPLKGVRLDLFVGWAHCCRVVDLTTVAAPPFVSPWGTIVVDEEDEEDSTGYDPDADDDVVSLVVLWDN